MILAIESATPNGSVALLAGESVLGETVLPRGRQASETYLLAVDGLIAACGGKPERITHVAVSAGPGSFTGLRVGMAAAKGLCLGWGRPLVAVPTLHALARRFPLEGTTVCPVLDAKKKEVYAGFYRWEGGACVRIAPDAAVSPQRLPALLPPGRVFFCGDGTVPYGDLLRGSLGERAAFSRPGEGLPRASAVALLAALLIAEGGEADPRSAVPVYLRRSEAELRRSGEPLN